MHKLFTMALILTFLGTSCSTTEIPYGVQSGQIAYIPARIAVWPCTPWPYQTRYYRQTLTNVSTTELSTICTALDAFVIKGFKSQPYMRGLSPQVVKGLLDRAGAASMLQELPEQWSSSRSASCDSCKNPVDLYHNVISNLESWQQWLSKLSQQVYNVDALLVPFVIYARQGRIDDRGVAKAYYRIGVTLLLIDTTSGRLIWAGGRDAEVLNRNLDSRDQLQNVKFPKFDQVKERLLVKDIWREFPGRQNF